MERVPHELPLGRLEAFSDGVFAITSASRARTIHRLLRSRRQ